MTKIMQNRFAATLDGLGKATEYLEGFCTDPRIAVVFDELASNVVRCSGATSFDVRVTQGDDLVLELFDDGKPFDPTKTEDPNIALAAEEREIGGLGLFMVKKMTKSFTYERTDDARNHVTAVMK